MRMRQALCAAVSAALLLTGCSSRQSIEELLRAPQINEAQSAVQSALSGYLGETLQLKYPRGGSEMAPLIFTDLDGDGEEEAAALYVTESKGTDVHLAILENRNGGWSVAYEIAGLGPEVASVEETHVLGEGTQLVVGYANTTLTDKYLAVYSYRADSVTQLYTCAYTSYIAQDLLPSGGTELIVVLPVTQASVEIAVLGETASGVGVRQTLSLGESFVSCDGLYVTASGGRTGLIADGASSDEGRVSELFVVENDYLLLGGEDVPQLTRRTVAGLDPTDFSGRGAVELPTLIESVNTINYSRRFYFVTWKDLLNGDPEPPPEEASEPPFPSGETESEESVDPGTEESAPEQSGASGPQDEAPDGAGAESGAEEPPADPEPEPTLAQLDAASREADGMRFGVYDAANGFFLRLPLAWRGGIVLADGTGQVDWLVRDAETNEVLVSVRVVDRDETLNSDSYSLAGFTENKKIYVNIPSRVDEGAARIVSTGFCLMQ